MRMSTYLSIPMPFQREMFSRLRHVRAGASAVLIAAAQSDAFTNIVTTTVPPNERGILVGYGIQVQDPTYDYGGSLVFRIIVQDSPIDDGAPFTEQRGDLINPAPAQFYVNAGNIVAIQARRSVAYAFAQRISAVLLLYTWPKTLGEMFPGEYTQSREPSGFRPSRE